MGHSGCISVLRGKWFKNASGTKWARSVRARRRGMTLSVSVRLASGALALLLPAHGAAQEITPEALPSDIATPAKARAVLRVETRARYEWADAADTGPASEALTVRIRPSLEFTASPKINILGEVEAIAALLPDRRNGFLDPAGGPAIADAQSLELNRLQIEWTPSEAIGITLGRQRISLDDERFIGTVDFRQNQQTYDALTAAWQLPGKSVLQAGYIWRVGRILGAEQPGGVFDSDSFYAHLAVPVPAGQVSLYHYDLDLDDRIGGLVQLRTTGVAWRGRAFPRGLGLFWDLAYARQHSGSRTPDYWRAGASIERGELGFSLRAERLGSDDGTAFQTPLATLHRFQGAVDLFLETPAQGVTDVEARATWRIGSLGLARATGLTVQFNRFNAASGSERLGEEWGGELATTLVDTRLSLAAAHYRAASFGADTTRVWVTASRDF
jgi:hypothetical protein